MLGGWMDGGGDVTVTDCVAWGWWGRVEGRRGENEEGKGIIGGVGGSGLGLKEAVLWRSERIRRI